MINRVIEFPSWAGGEVDGWKLTERFTGTRRHIRILDYEDFKTDWWVCEDCQKRIPIGKPYASKVDFNRRDEVYHFPIFIKCISCYINMLEEYDLANLN
ncbi:hypothetical protein ES708_34232 [subsurface metagenome]